MFNEEKHHLILMDLHMPVCDGYQATSQLRAKGVKVPILALTASILSGESKKIINTGLDDIIIKPFDPEKFLATIKRSIGTVRNANTVSQ
jgi:CheY-like chemotaxis protein